MTFYFVDANSIMETTLTSSDEANFNVAPLTMRMFNVGAGEAILLSRGTEGVLFDGGLNRNKRENAPLQCAQESLRRQRAGRFPHWSEHLDRC